MYNFLIPVLYLFIFHLFKVAEQYQLIKTRMRIIRNYNCQSMHQYSNISTFLFITFFCPFLFVFVFFHLIYDLTGHLLKVAEDWEIINIFEIKWGDYLERSISTTPHGKSIVWPTAFASTANFWIEGLKSQEWKDSVSQFSWIPPALPQPPNPIDHSILKIMFTLSQKE